MSNLKPILHKLLFHLTPKGRLNWDPTGKVGSSPPTPSDCQQSLWHPPTPPGTSSAPLEPLWAPAMLEPGCAGPAEAGGRSSQQDAPPRVGCGGLQSTLTPPVPQSRGFMWLCGGCGVGPSTHPVPAECAAPRGPDSFQTQQRVEEK